VMERRLQEGIMNPAMIATWVLGLILAWAGNWWLDLWFDAKVVLVIAMTAFNFWLTVRRREFAEDRNRYSSRAYRIVNELPTLLVVAIVVLVVVKPF
jgi:protoporphyrinogen IX oxidase